MLASLDPALDPDVDEPPLALAFAHDRNDGWMPHDIAKPACARIAHNAEDLPACVIGKTQGLHDEQRGPVLMPEAFESRGLPTLLASMRSAERPSEPPRTPPRLPGVVARQVCPPKPSARPPRECRSPPRELPLPHKAAPPGRRRSLLWRAGPLLGLGGLCLTGAVATMALLGRNWADSAESRHTARMIVVGCGAAMSFFAVIGLTALARGAYILLRERPSAGHADVVGKAGAI